MANEQTEIEFPTTPTETPAVTPEPRPQTLETKPELAHRDPWDEPGAVNTEPPAETDVDPMAKYRTGKGYDLTSPAYVPLDEGNLADWGRIATREGIPQELAQGLVDAFASGEQSETRNAGDPDRALSELRLELGEQLEPTLLKVGEFCAQRPALSAYLDSTGLGNSATVLRLLSAAVLDPSLITKPGAEKFIGSRREQSVFRWRPS